MLNPQHSPLRTSGLAPSSSRTLLSSIPLLWLSLPLMPIVLRSTCQRTKLTKVLPSSIKGLSAAMASILHMISLDQLACLAMQSDWLPVAPPPESAFLFRDLPVQTTWLHGFFFLARVMNRAQVTHFSVCPCIGDCEEKQRGTRSRRILWLYYWWCFYVFGKKKYITNWY